MENTTRRLVQDKKRKKELKDGMMRAKHYDVLTSFNCYRWYSDDLHLEYGPYGIIVNQGESFIKERWIRFMFSLQESGKCNMYNAGFVLQSIGIPRDVSRILTLIYLKECQRLRLYTAFTLLCKVAPLQIAALLYTYLLGVKDEDRAKHITSTVQL